MVISMENQQLPFILQIKDIQQILGFSKSHTYEIVKTSDFPLLKINNRMVVKRDEFFNWLETKRVNSSSQSA